MTLVWFDTEFIEDGRIDLISIGMVREDGAEYYAQAEECDRSRASQWVVDNVFPHLLPDTKPRAQIACEIVEFVGPHPEFWAYYADYDWVVLCQLFGTMMDLPTHWPKFCLDLKQEAHRLGIKHFDIPQGIEHHALADAHWNRRVWEVVLRQSSELALQRADRLIQWMTSQIGNMAPGDYAECYRDLNEHGMFMDRLKGHKP